MIARRSFLTLLGGAAAAWPMAARAQQAGMPVIGYLGAASADGSVQFVTAFRQGLNEAGLVEGQNVAIEFRFAEGRSDQLPAMANELVQRRVAVIAAIGGRAPAIAARAADSAIPIVFLTGSDPVKDGLVASLNRPGGSVTGVTLINSLLGAKRLGLLHELLPKATTIAVLLNPANPATEDSLQDMQAAAATMGLQLHVLRAASQSDIDAAFKAVAQRRPDALVVASDAFFTSRREQIVALVAHLAIPAIHSPRDWVVAGGLISYGTDTSDSYRQAGVYTSRILKGEKPADLPVVLPTKFELVINLKTAKALGLTISPGLLSIVDEVIE